jgi:hypothetical protein
MVDGLFAANDLKISLLEAYFNLKLTEIKWIIMRLDLKIT